MYIRLCDRCGRGTKNGLAFLLPVQPKNGQYQLNGTWFGEEGVCLCNNCLVEFEKFRTEHERFNTRIDYESEKV